MAKDIGFAYSAYPNDHPDYEDMVFEINRDFVLEAVPKLPDGKTDLSQYVFVETGEDGGVFLNKELAAYLIKAAALSQVSKEERV